MVLKEVRQRIYRTEETPFKTTLFVLTEVLLKKNLCELARCIQIYENILSHRR